MNIDWNLYNNLLDTLITEIEEKEYVPTIIVGIARGGLVPAVMMSHRLKIPMLAHHISYRDKSEISSDIDNLIHLIGHSVLVVTDINATGETLQTLEDQFYKLGLTFRVASLINKSSSEYMTDYTAHVHTDNTRVIFPWEV